MRHIIIAAAVVAIGILGWTAAGRAEVAGRPERAGRIEGGGRAGANADKRAEARAAREKAAADAKTERDAKAALAKATREKARAEAEAKAKADAEARTAEAEARKEKRDTEKTPDRAKEIDRREGRQEKRIEHGIKKGYLTDEEVSKLTSQQDRIKAMEEGIKSDGKITREEFKGINQALNDASRAIWAEKHDTDGNQMPTYRLGKNVFAKDEFTAKMADENLSKAEAKALLKDFHHLTDLKRTLATKDLTDAQRKAMQEEYNTLLNKYFETR